MKPIFYLYLASTLSMVLSICLAVEKPNIILILTDDQGYDDYGFRIPELDTPHLDKICTQGVRFDRFYTASACAPTRSALMTGRNFLKTGTSAVGYGAESPHLDEYLLGQAMQDAGYKTALMGKWNLGLADADLPSRRGFDETWPIIREDVRSYGRYEHFNAPFFHNGEYSGREDGWQVEVVTNKAIQFIEENKNNPFFLYIPYAQPHEPWLCPKDLQDKYRSLGFSPEYSMFLGMMEQLDQQIGRVLASVEKENLSENTVFLFFGDNGPTPTTRYLEKQEDGHYKLVPGYYTMTDEEWSHRNPSGLREKKATGWENAMRNRLSIYCPSKFKPKVIHDMTLVMDVYPTILELADHSFNHPTHKLDGKSLIPLISDNTDWNERIYFTGETGKPEQSLSEDGWNYRFTKESLPLDQRSTCFIQGDWVVVYHLGEWGLFNVKEDLGQKNDLKKQMPEKFLSMKEGFYEEWSHILEDKHAYSDPVQIIGLEGVKTSYVEIEGAYRFKGKNNTTWANTFFYEVGATQELKIRSESKSSYKLTLRAVGVPEDTEISLSAGETTKKIMLNEGKNYHYLGTFDFLKGDQTIRLSLLKTRDLKQIKKMELFSLNLEKI